MTTAEQILGYALELPADQRALIAERLIENLDSEGSSKDVEIVWNKEIRRRMDEVNAGTAGSRSWKEVREQLDRKLQAVRTQ